MPGRLCVLYSSLSANSESIERSRSVGETQLGNGMRSIIVSSDLIGGHRQGWQNIEAGDASGGPGYGLFHVR